MTETITQLIHEPEGKTLEFKQDLSSPRRWLKTLVAFANSAGGKLILGVSDDRQVYGIEHPLDEEERLANLVADSIAPRLVPNIELVTLEGKTVLVVEVFLSGLRPHFVKAEGMENGVYVRLGSTNRQADPQLIRELQRGVAGVSFDALPMPDLDVDTIDLEALQTDFDTRNVDEHMLQSLRILVRNQGRLVPSQGGILLYGKERRSFFDDAWVQCGRFVGVDKGDIFDHIDIHTPLPRAVDEIMLFLKKHAMRGADFTDLRRKDLWSIPVAILREVVVNALVHADYSHQGTPIRVAFFDDRIEVENPGLLLPGLTVEDMKKGVSQIRNPVIARVFRELDLIEQWGSGIPAIFREVKQKKLPEPTIEELTGRVRFTIPLSEIVVPTGEQSRHTSREKQAQSATQSATQSPTQSPTQSDDPVKKILKQLENGEKSSGELRELLNLSHRKTFRDNYLHPALDKGLIEYTIPDKPNSRLQKYRLTKKGQAMLSGKDAAK